MWELSQTKSEYKACLWCLQLNTTGVLTALRGHVFADQNPPKRKRRKEHPGEIRMTKEPSRMKPLLIHVVSQDKWTTYADHCTTRQ